MDNSYKSRRTLYKIVNRDRERYSERDVYIAEGTTNDFTLSTNDVADILSFSAEHVRNNILKELDVCSLVDIKDNDYRADARLYMDNNRLQKCISKSSLERYITSSLRISSRYDVVEIQKDSELVEELKEILGKRAKIQKLFDDVGLYLDVKYNAKQLMKNEQERIARLKVAAVNNNSDFDILHYLETGSLDTAEIISYYNDLEDNLKNEGLTEFFDILTFDMYSIKDLREKLGVRHNNQVYRYIDKVSHIAIKLNDDEYDEDDRKMSDRNIRYIISNKCFNMPKGVYRLQLDYYVHEKLNSLAETMPGFLSTEDILYKEILDFAEANKEKYVKKEEEKNESE